MELGVVEWSLLSLFIFNYLSCLFLARLHWNIYSAQGICYIHRGKDNVARYKWLVFLFCMFAGYAGDFHHYQLEFDSLTRFPDSYTHMEAMYPWLISHLCYGEYMLFRLIIWGGAVWTYQKALKRMGLDSVFVWVCFAAISLTTAFAIGRGSLGFGLIMLGYSYLIVPGKNKKLSTILGALCIIGALFTHKSIVLLIPPILLSFVKINFKRSVAIAVVMPLLIAAFRNYLIGYFEGTTVETAGQSYFVGTLESFGIGLSLWRYSCYLIVYLILGFFAYRIIVKHMPIDGIVRRIFFFTVILWFEYFLMYMAFTRVGEGDDAMSYRIFTLTYITLPILLGHAMKENYNNKLTYGTYLLAFFTSNYFLLYNMYTNALAK